MKNVLKNQRGETIVEVLVSFVLLLMFTAMFVVSLRYARSMSLKAESLRQTAYEFCAGLYPAGGTPKAWTNDTTVPEFNFGQFSVKDVTLQQVETSSGDDRHTFYRYYKAAETETTP